MRSGTIAFLFGVLALLHARELPDPFLVEFLPLLLLALAFGGRGLRPPGLPALIALSACGALWTLLRAGAVLQRDLPAALEGRDLSVVGTIASIPAADGRRTRFRFDVESTRVRPGARVPAVPPGPVLLNWYGGAPVLHPGDRWLLTVRLKRAHGFMNPGGFDYERWLFEQGIRATGYVRSRGERRRLGIYAGYYALPRLRQRLAVRIDAALAGRDETAVVKALALGVRDGIPESRWRLLRATGTSHLLAISGLHIGLVAGLLFLLVRALWSWAGRSALLLAAPRAAAVAGMLGAAGYAALAGFSIPTQRALVMTAVALGSIYLRRSTPASASFAAALLVVLVVDPLSVLSPGFWLSFCAVAVILLGMTGRLAPRTLWWNWGRVQWLAAIGLLPLTLLFFGQHPLIAPLANAVAVPWVGFVSVPLVLSGTAVSVASPAAGSALLHAAAASLDVLWPVLEWLRDLGAVYHVQRTPPPWAVLAAGVGVCLTLLPRGVPARWLGAVWVLPALMAPPASPPAGRLMLTVLDVGQGLAVLARTRRHTLLFDTGPRFGPHWDAGSAVIVPFLREAGVATLDALVVSHPDGDHSGGLSGVREGVEVRRTLAGYPLPGAEPCTAGLSWRWDGFDFRIVHPAAPSGRDNNDSCVLRISRGDTSALLPGDIEREGERELVERAGRRVASDVLVVPHHGSTTSSTPRFLDAVRPRFAVYSVGYRNRFRFPRAEVVARYRRRRVSTYETARCGALTFVLGAETGVPPPLSYRVRAGRFWNHPLGCAAETHPD